MSRPSRREGEGATRRFTRLLPALLLLIHPITQYAAAWRTSFVNEDWAFVDMARGRSLPSLLTDPALYAGPWLRPRSYAAAISVAS